MAKFRLKILVKSSHSNKDTIKTIKVYSGPGASVDRVKSTVDVLKRLLSSRYVVQQVTAEDLVSPAWKSSTSLLVFPGGQTTPYVRDLTGIPISNTKENIKDGGNYLGFGAGAYFAAKRVEFMPGTPYEVMADRPLEFYPDTMYGTTFPGFDYKSEKGALATNITFSFPNKNESIESLVYFNGGGSFLNFNSYPNVKNLATYNDVANKSHESAVVLCDVVKGKVLSAVHPEYFPSKPTNTLYNKLHPYKSTIESIFNKWFQLLDIELISNDNISKTK